MRPLVLILTASLQALLAGCAGQSTGELPRTRALTDRVFERTELRLERGKYLAGGILQCLVCHSERNWDLPGAPPITGREGAGQVFYDDSLYFLAAPNITSDMETGAGRWTDDMLARAIREGIGHDGRALHPQMWYSSFRTLCDEDLASVIVYVRSLPPVKNAFPPRRLPAHRLEEIAGDPEPLTEPVPPPDLSSIIKRGEYLTGIADCSGCHSAWEAPYFPGIFGGGNLVDRRRPDGGFEKTYSSNITQDPSGISYYDDSLFIEVIRTGRLRAREINAIMPWVAFRNLTDDDLHAVFVYLKTQRPVVHIIDNSQEPTACPMCGQDHGEGKFNSSKLDLIHPLRVGKRELVQYEGLYENPDFSISFHIMNDTLKGTSSGDTLTFMMGMDSLFYAREWPAPISFDRDSRGRIVSMTSHEERKYEAIRK